MDLFVVPTIGFDLLYGLVIVRLARRDLVWINVISSGFLFALETAQGAKFDAGQWMDGRPPMSLGKSVPAAKHTIPDWFL
jgi:hypothetical protein